MTPLKNCTRVCKTCGEKKPIISFSKHSSCSGGRRHTCNHCRSLKASPETKRKHIERAAKWNKENPESRRATWLKYKYGITLATYDMLLALQDGLCAICKKSGAGRNNTTYLYVDHDHVTGIIRGLLCHPCNS